MALYDAWKRVSLDAQGQPVKHAWDEYMAKEKTVYIQLLKDKTTKIDMTVAEFAEKYRISPMHVTAFIDGIHEAVDGLPHPPDDVTEETKMTFDIDHARLYKQMVAYKAQELYSLPEWENFFTPEEQKQLYTEEKRSHTVVRNEEKIRPNDPCKCGSGKKYKKCCAGAA